jgi:hypothetical protein
VNAARTDVGSAWRALVDVEDTIAEALDPAIVGICGLRISSILDNSGEADRASASLPSAKVAALTHWPRASPALTGMERACLAFAEQFVIDVTSVDDELVDAVASHLAPEVLYLFVRWVQSNEARQRAELVLRHDQEVRSSP